MTTSRALANKERDRQFMRLAVLSKRMLLTTATVMTFLTIILVVVDKLYHPESFAITQLKLKGQFAYVEPMEVQQVVFAEPLGNFFSVSLENIKRDVEALAWVQKADVRREWPDALVVSVFEHRPVSQWRSIDGDESNLWVTASGEIVSAEKMQNNSSPFVLRGVNRDSKRLLLKALQWRTQLARRGIEIDEVSLSASQSWQLRLKYFGQMQSFTLLLGRENVDQRMSRFQTLYDSHFRNASERLLRVDARYPDGIAVRSEVLEPASELEVEEANLNG